MSDEQKTAEDWLKQMHIWWDNAETFNRVTFEKTGRLAKSITGADLDAYYLDLIQRIINSTLERAAKVAEQGLTTFSPLEIARAIRALKEPS